MTLFPKRVQTGTELLMMSPTRKIANPDVIKSLPARHTNIKQQMKHAITGRMILKEMDCFQAINVLSSIKNHFKWVS